MSHHCHARGCYTPCRPEMLMCQPHWRMVPLVLSKAVLAHYRAGQCSGRPSSEWLVAARAAIECVAKKEADILARHPRPAHPTAAANQKGE